MIQVTPALLPDLACIQRLMSTVDPLVRKGHDLAGRYQQKTG
jgi:hypothetical protein